MDYDADRDFVRRLQRLRGHQRWILGGSAGCSFLALVVSLLLPKIYRATTYVLVSEPKIGSTLPTGAWQYALIRTYLPFVDSDALLTNALHDLHLDQAPYEMTVEKFRKRGYLDVDFPKSTRLLEINVEFPDAQLAADLANYLAQNAVKFNDRLTASDTEVTQAFLRKRLEEVRNRLAQVERERLQIRERAKLEDKERELVILLDTKQQLAGQLQQLSMASAQNSAKAMALQAHLASEPRIFNLRKNVFSDPLLKHAVTQSGGTAEAEFSVSEETVNSAHEKLTTQYADALADAQGNRAGFQAGETRLAQVNGSIGRLLSEVAQRRSEIERVDREYTVAKEAFETASRDYLNASVIVTSKSQDLKQLAPAVPPERPVRPRLVLNVVLATLLGFALLTLLALARESYRAMQLEGFLPEAQEDRHHFTRVES